MGRTLSRIAWVPEAVARRGPSGLRVYVRSNTYFLDLFSCDSRAFRYLSDVQGQFRPADTKQSKMKANTETAPTTAPIITESKVHETLAQLAKDLEIPAETCTSEQYGLLIFGSLMRLGISARPDAEFLPLAAQAWVFIPKNPSAMRQHLNRAEKDASAPAVSKLLGKLLPPTQS